MIREFFHNENIPIQLDCNVYDTNQQNQVINEMEYDESKTPLITVDDTLQSFQPTHIDSKKLTLTGIHDISFESKYSFRAQPLGYQSNNNFIPQIEKLSLSNEPSTSLALETSFEVLPSASKSKRTSIQSPKKTSSTI